MRTALRTLASLSAWLVASLAAGQPGAPVRSFDAADLAVRQRAAMQMTLTVIIALVVIVLLLQLLGRPKRMPGPDVGEDGKPQ